MKLYIQHQQKYSRIQLLLRTFFGIFYILVPHGVLLFAYSLLAPFVYIYAWFAILFTTRYPKFAYSFFVGFFRWYIRVSASIFNLVDGYPPFGPNAKWDKVNLDIDYPEIVTRKRLLFVTFFGLLAVMPHFIILYIILTIIYILWLISFFAILFTGAYPKGIHDILVGMLRLNYRVTFYLFFMYFEYPGISFSENETDQRHSKKS